MRFSPGCCICEALMCGWSGLAETYHLQAEGGGNISGFSNNGCADCTALNSQFDLPFVGTSHVCLSTQCAVWGAGFFPAIGSHCFWSVNFFLLANGTPGIFIQAIKTVCVGGVANYSLRAATTFDPMGTNIFDLGFENLTSSGDCTAVAASLELVPVP